MDIKELEELPVEIVELEDLIEKAKKKNKISKLNCNLKKIRGISKLGVTFLTIPVAATIITTANGWNPFKLNYVKTHPIVETSIDRDFQIKETEKGYETLLTMYDCKLYYYSDWEETENNNFKREKYTFNISADDLDRIMSLKDKDLSYEKIKELFGLDIRSTTEYMGGITDKSGYIEAVIQKKAEDKTIVVKEKLVDHISLMFIKTLLEAISIVFELMILYGIVKPDFDLGMSDIKSKAKLVDVENLEKKLKEKRLLFEETLFLTSLNKFDKELNESANVKKMKY